MSNLLFLFASVACGACEMSPRWSGDLNEIRLGLEALNTSWRSREIRYVMLKSVNGSAADPNRTEGVLKQNADGKFYVDNVAYHDGMPIKRIGIAFDGTKYSRLQYQEPLPSDPSMAAIDRVEITVKSDVAKLHFPHELNLEYGERTFASWIEIAPARVLNHVTLDGATCTRVEISLPSGVMRIPPEQRVLLDIDPLIDYWPRRIEFSVIPEGPTPSRPIEFSEFRQVDGYWFPHKIVRPDPNRPELRLIQSVSFNQVNIEDFQMKLALGTEVRDESAGHPVLGITGGEEGARMRREAIKSQIPQNKVTNVNRTQSNLVVYIWPAVIGLIGIAALVTAWILRRRYQ